MRITVPNEGYELQQEITVEGRPFIVYDINEATGEAAAISGFWDEDKTFIVDDACKYGEHDYQFATSWHDQSKDHTYSCSRCHDRIKWPRECKPPR